MDELAFENHGIVTDKINFGQDKNAMLNALLYDINNHRWAVPPIKGLQNQALRYNRDMDNKIPQDIIMAWAELSLLVRTLPGEVAVTTPVVKVADPRLVRMLARRGRRYPSGTRSNPYRRR